jgi:hypothetical protein
MSKTAADAETVLEIFRSTGMLRFELTVRMDRYKEILITAIKEAIGRRLKTTDVE